MPNVHYVATRAAASVDKEWLVLLVPVQNHLKITVREDDMSSEEVVRLVAGNLLESLEQSVINNLGSELLHEFVVVDRLDLAVFSNVACNTPRRNVLLLCCSLGRIEALRRQVAVLHDCKANSPGAYECKVHPTD